MKHLWVRGHLWREPPRLEELFGITESGKGLIALFIVALVLAALVLGFIYSTSPGTVRLPMR